MTFQFNFATILDFEAVIIALYTMYIYYRILILQSQIKKNPHQKFKKILANKFFRYYQLFVYTISMHTLLCFNLVRADFGFIWPKKR